MAESKLRPFADLKVKVREYTGEDGKKKGVYAKFGTLFATPHLTHMFVAVESIPVNFDGKVSVFKRDDFQEEEVDPAKPITLEDIPF